MKLIKKMDGAISIFLCLVLTSMIVLSGFLIDGSRFRAGEAQSQAAAENSMRSALADYNKMLKDLYGLFALPDGSQDALNEEIEAYMNKTLMTELGISKETMGEQMYGYLRSILTNSGTRKDADFLNLFDYGIEELQSESMYNLAQTEVLEKQIIDYMKYRGPREITGNLLDKLGLFKEFGKQSGTMKKKIKLDKDFDVVRKDSESLSDAIDYINNFSTSDGSRIDELYNSFKSNVSEKAYMELKLQLEQENTKNILKEMDELQPDLNRAQNQVNNIILQMAQVASAATPENAIQIQQALMALGEVLSVAQNVLADIKEEYNSLTESYEDSKNKCEQYKEKILANEKTALQNKETMTELINACINKCTEAEFYISRVTSETQNINSDIKDINENDLNGQSGDFANSIRLDLAGKSNIISAVKLKEIKKACINNKELLEELRTLIGSVDYKSIHGTKLPGILGMDMDSISYSDVEGYIALYLKNQEVIDLLKKYIGRFNQNPIQYGVKKLNEAASANDPRSTFQEIINTVKNKKELSGDTGLESKASPSVPDDSELVSKSQITKKDYSREDAQYINTILSGYQNIAAQDNRNSEVSLEPGIEELKDILNNADFRKDEENFSSPGLDFLMNIGKALKGSMEGMRDTAYINEYAMGNFKNALSQKSAHGNQPEKDLSGILKSKRTTYYDGEIEYILCGMKNQQNNIYAVEAQILLVRFALNTLAIYMDPEKTTQSLAVAEAIAGVTVFGVPVVQTLILLGWSLAESIADVKLIMDGGKVPVYKMKGDWLLDETTALKDFARVSAGQAGNKIIDIGESSIKDLTEAAKGKIDGMVERKISNAVDKTFAPLEAGLNKSGETTEDISNSILDLVDTDMTNIQGNTNQEIQRTITALAAEEFNACRANIEEAVKNQPQFTAINIINTKKNDIKSSINSRVSYLTKKLKTEIDEAAGKGADNLKEYLSTALGEGGSSKGGSVISSMSAMGYQDYLRLFLLLRGNNTKLLRIADLIQLDMRLESHEKSFRLENCNTYIRLNATVSMKYLFMTSSFMPRETRLNSESRHRINLLIYQGY